MCCNSGVTAQWRVLGYWGPFPFQLIYLYQLAPVPDKWMSGLNWDQEEGETDHQIMCQVERKREIGLDWEAENEPCGLSPHSL